MIPDDPDVSIGAIPPLQRFCRAVQLFSLSSCTIFGKFTSSSLQYTTKTNTRNVNVLSLKTFSL